MPVNQMLDSLIKSVAFYNPMCWSWTALKSDAVSCFCLIISQSFTVCVPLLWSCGAHGQPVNSETVAEVHRGISCWCKTFQCGHVWMLQDTERGKELEKKKKTTQWESDWDEWPHLKVPQKYLCTFLNISEMFVRLMSGTVFCSRQRCFMSRSCCSY